MSDTKAQPELMTLVELMIQGSNKPTKKQQRSLNRKATLAKAKATAKPAALPHPLLSTRWTDESITLVVRELHCACGSVHRSPCENIFIKRYHPQFGVHEVPIPLREWSPFWLLLPRRMEVHEVPIAVCHECFSTSRVAPLLAQPQLFHTPEVIHSHVDAN